MANQRRHICGDSRGCGTRGRRGVRLPPSGTRQDTRYDEHGVDRLPASTDVRCRATAATNAKPTPTPIELSATGDSVYVSTKSGKTACQVTVNTVSCIVRFVGRTPIRYGVPTNVVMITSGGIMDWTVGDGGQLQTHTLNYGTLYHALGWTITPTSEGTTFTNDATGRGMSVNVDGARAF